MPALEIMPQYPSTKVKTPEHWYASQGIPRASTNESPQPQQQQQETAAASSKINLRKLFQKAWRGNKVDSSKNSSGKKSQRVTEDETTAHEESYSSGFYVPHSIHSIREEEDDE